MAGYSVEVSFAITTAYQSVVACEMDSELEMGARCALIPLATSSDNIDGP